MNTRIAGLMFALTGCIQNTGSSQSQSNPTTPILDTPVAGQECTSGVPSTIVNAQIDTMQQTADSYHEMVACGGLAYELSASVYRILIGSLLESNGVSVPGDYIYDGEGHYVTGSGGTTMYVSYLFGDDSQAGNEDDLVVDNLFDFSNYLRGVSATLDPLSQELLVSYTSAGPLVELLGEGANPPNPLRLAIEDIEQPYRLGRLKMVIEAPVDDVRTGATVTYVLGAGPNRLNPLLSGNSELTFDLIGSSTLSASGATLTSTDVGIDYDDSPGILDGDIPFTLRGGGLDLDGVFSFVESTNATIDWWCPE